MSQSQPVPKLDLAPKLKRSLSLWNPLDYLRLLYWVFYFPQAIRWYVNVIARNETDFSDAKTLRERLRWFFENPIARLWLQGWLLQITTPFLIYYLLVRMGMSFSWSNIAFSALIITLVSVNIGAVIGASIKDPMLTSISVCTAISIGSSICTLLATITSDVNIEAKFNGVSILQLMIIVIGIVSLINAVSNYVTLNKLSSMVIFLPMCLFIISIGLAYNVILGIALAAIAVRLENWLWGFCPRIRRFRRQKRLIPRVTLLPFPLITSQLIIWLQQDWQSGLKIADQLLRYTFQFTPVIRAVNSVLTKLPSEVVITHVAQLADIPPSSLSLIWYSSASLKNNLRAQFFHGLPITPLLRRILTKDINTGLRLDSPVRAAAAGFWYLRVWKPEQAIAAFQVVESLPHGAEMLLLATILDRSSSVSDLSAIAALNLPPTPHPPLLRPETWSAIDALRRASEDIRVVCNAASRTARAFASNRALGDLNAILETPEVLPIAERGLILAIAQTWRDSLLKSVGEIGRIEILKPVQNPYITGDPVQGSLFVGRDDILRQLEELWFINHQLQSVVLYGHRRMGKTSILRNVSDRLGSTTQLIYVNLLLLGDTQSVGEVLSLICDEIAQVTDRPAPSLDDLLTFPELIFKRYLQSLIQSPDSKGLIIALDEFEQLESLITAGKLPPTFLAYLRGLVQMSPKLAFAFAGLHTLEEMTEDYFSPFFASIIPIRISFLDRASTRQLLANPSDEFPLDYAPEVYDAIFDLTAGQPYLVQLLGFYLVRRYNTQVFEQGRDRSHQFTLDDLHAITSDRTLFINGRYYFTGVWQQAAHAPTGQQAILSAIAPFPEGLPRTALLQYLDSAALDAALESLQRHDVIHEVNQNWCIKVELFRRWVVQAAIEQ